VLRSSQQEGKRGGRHTWWVLVAGEGPGEDVRRAPRLAQSPPPGKEGREGEGGRERKRGAGRGEREKEIDGEQGRGARPAGCRHQRRLDGRLAAYCLGFLHLLLGVPLERNLNYLSRNNVELELYKTCDPTQI
jgi:hypothetical protein